MQSKGFEMKIKGDTLFLHIMLTLLKDPELSLSSNVCNLKIQIEQLQLQRNKVSVHSAINQ